LVRSKTAGVELALADGHCQIASAAKAVTTSRIPAELLQVQRQNTIFLPTTAPIR
jgi:hypothetical protein